jgi:hypothetical protein
MFHDDMCLGDTAQLHGQGLAVTRTGLPARTRDAQLVCVAELCDILRSAGQTTLANLTGLDARLCMELYISILWDGSRLNHQNRSK